jgi:hypothetical protein
MYSFAVCLLFNLRLNPFSPVTVYTDQTLIGPGMVVFAIQIAAENGCKVKQSTVVGINGSWNY